MCQQAQRPPQSGGDFENGFAPQKPDATRPHRKRRIGRLNAGDARLVGKASARRTLECREAEVAFRVVAHDEPGAPGAQRARRIEENHRGSRERLANPRFCGAGS